MKSKYLYNASVIPTHELKTTIQGLSPEQTEVLLEKVNQLIANNSKALEPKTKFRKETSRSTAKEKEMGLSRSLIQDTHGNYFILGDRKRETLGVGAFSEVRTAYCLLSKDGKYILGPEFVVKETKGEDDEKNKRAYKRVVKYEYSGATEQNRNQKYYLFTEKIQGKNLLDCIIGGDLKAMPLVERLDVIEGLLSEISQLHQKNKVHNDIKSLNVMLNAETRKTTLIDYELATTEGKKFKGRDLLYANPEMVNSECARKSQDIYATGMVIAEILLTDLEDKPINLEQKDEACNTYWKTNPIFKKKMEVGDMFGREFAPYAPPKIKISQQIFDPQQTNLSLEENQLLANFLTDYLCRMTDGDPKKCPTIEETSIFFQTVRQYCQKTKGIKDIVACYKGDEAFEKMQACQTDVHRLNDLLLERQKKRFQEEENTEQTITARKDREKRQMFFKPLLDKTKRELDGLKNSSIDQLAGDIDYHSLKTTRERLIRELEAVYEKIKNITDPSSEIIDYMLGFLDGSQFTDDLQQYKQQYDLALKRQKASQTGSKVDAVAPKGQVQQKSHKPIASKQPQKKAEGSDDKDPSKKGNAPTSLVQPTQAQSPVILAADAATNKKEDPKKEDPTVSVKNNLLIRLNEYSSPVARFFARIAWGFTWPFAKLFNFNPAFDKFLDKQNLADKLKDKLMECDSPQKINTLLRELNKSVINLAQKPLLLDVEKESLLDTESFHSSIFTDLEKNLMESGRLKALIFNSIQIFRPLKREAEKNVEEDKNIRELLEVARDSLTDSSRKPDIIRQIHQLYRAGIDEGRNTSINRDTEAKWYEDSTRKYASKALQEEEMDCYLGLFSKSEVDHKLKR